MALIPIHQAATTGPIVWTVPSNQTWQLIVGHVIFTTSATGGNRWLTFTIKSPDGHVIWDAHAGNKQGSSAANQYRFSQGGENRETAFIDNDILVPIPRQALLLSNYTMTLEDADAIDVAADTFAAHGLINVLNTNNPRPDQLL